VKTRTRLTVAVAAVASACERVAQLLDI